MKPVPLVSRKNACVLIRVGMLTFGAFLFASVLGMSAETRASRPACHCWKTVTFIPSAKLNPHRDGWHAAQGQQPGRELDRERTDGLERFPWTSDIVS